MPGLYSHTTRTTGTVLTAAIYNADHQNHIDNQIPTMADDYSDLAVTMQAETNPYPSGAESLATTLAGEIERIRFILGQMKSGNSSGAYWYKPSHAQGDPMMTQSFGW